MLLQRFIREIDAELDRLSQIRKIMATLASSRPAEPSSPKRREKQSQSFETAPASPAESLAQPVPLVAKAESAAVAPGVTALRGNIPQQPVVIGAAQAALARDRRSAQSAQRSPATQSATAPEGTLDALVRELTRRMPEPASAMAPPSALGEVARAEAGD
jgi:hypothetical protein